MSGRRGPYLAEDTFCVAAPDISWLSCASGSKPCASAPALQVQKLSWEDGGLYHRQLYMRNVGSTVTLAAHDGAVDASLPPPSRVPGDIIRFKRCATTYDHLFYTVTTPQHCIIVAAFCCCASHWFKTHQRSRQPCEDVDALMELSFCL